MKQCIDAKNNHEMISFYTRHQDLLKKRNLPVEDTKNTLYGDTYKEDYSC